MIPYLASWQNIVVRPCKNSIPYSRLPLSTPIIENYDCNSIAIIMNSFVVGDPTNPKDILCPNLLSEPATGVKFKPLECLLFSHYINLSISIDSKNAFGIWSLFFTLEQLQIIADNTNKH